MRRASRWALAAAALALLGAGALGCSDDAGTAEAAAETTLPAADVLTSTTTTGRERVGEEVSRFALQAGDCFNVYEGQTVITRLPCDQPHDREVFHTESHPAPHGEPFPGDREMQRYASGVCYRQFQPFTGGLYEVSELELGAFTPTKQNFEDHKARYRGITCFVYDPGEQLTGSMRGLGV